MKRIDVNKLSKEIHFPVQHALPTKRKTGFFGRTRDFFLYRRLWETDLEYIIWCEYLKLYIYIPAHFVYDGASVPKALHSIYNPTGVLLMGACPHDFGYRYQGLLHVDEETGDLYFQSYTKDELDDIFKALCIWESGMAKASGTATFTLTLFGFTGWNENRKENRVLRRDHPEIYCDYKGNVDALL